jgi:(p)ppGpp synthase/HD superfamily hydrolase
MMRKEAEILARWAHMGQLYDNQDYVDRHVADVVLRVSLDPIAPVECETVAWLHDVVEDTDVTLADLEEIGFPAAIVQAVDAITRRKDETYNEYMDRLEHDAYAVVVKYHDSASNYVAGGREKYAKNMRRFAPLAYTYWNNPHMPSPEYPTP